MKNLTHFINGEFVDGVSGEFSDVFNPSTGEVQAKLPLASVDEVNAAVAGAVEAQREWGAVNAQKRARILGKFVELCYENVDEIATALSSEHGKTFDDAKGDL